MRHGVNDIVDANANPERGVFLWILGIVGMLPGIAQIHVVADSHHQAALVVVNTAPMRLVAVLFRYAVSINHLLAGHLVAIVEVENRMENGAAVLDVHNGPVLKHAGHAGDEDIPFVAAVKIVAHEEAATEEE